MIILKGITAYRFPVQNRSLEPSAATTEEANILGIQKGAPVLLIKRTTYLQNGTAFEHAKSVYRGDRYTFVHYMDRLS